MDRRRLVQELIATDFQSPYLDRLRGRFEGARTAGGYGALQREILGEMAAALGRSEDHVNEALLRLDVLGRKIAALEARNDAGGESKLGSPTPGTSGPGTSGPESTPGRRGELRKAIVEFNELCDHAQRRLWELMVHREAIGIRNHELLPRLYPIPAKRSL
jgi:hypothetical protein